MASRADMLPPVQSDEARSLTALDALALLDGAPQQDFDALVALAAEMLDMPTAMLTLIDRDMLRVKATSSGIGDEAPRDLAICDHTIRADALMIVDDTRCDPRFATNPYVAREDGIRFYAGVPIHLPDADGELQAIGTLCVVDHQPRRFDEAGVRALRRLAALAEAMIAARAAARRAIEAATKAEQLAGDLAKHDRIFRQAERMAMIGSWRIALNDDHVDWSEGVARIHGLPVDHVPRLSEAVNYYPVEARDRVRQALANTIERGEPFEIEEDLIAADGRLRRIRAHAELERVDGEPVAVVGMFQDITDRYALETALRRSADTDALTGLANRAAFDRALDAAMRRARDDNTPLLLALIDLDGFKAINDTFGHTIGDDVLRAMSETLGDAWLEGSFAARLGGDEFAVIVEVPTLVADPEAFRERLEASLWRSVEVSGVAMACAGTVGVAALNRHASTVRDFVHQADTILYAAKRGRIGVRNGDRRERDRHTLERFFEQRRAAS